MYFLVLFLSCLPSYNEAQYLSFLFVINVQKGHAQSELWITHRKQDTVTASVHRKRQTGIAVKRHFIVNRFPIEQIWNYTGGIRIPLPQQTKQTNKVHSLRKSQSFPTRGNFLPKLSTFSVYWGFYLN